MNNFNKRLMLYSRIPQIRNRQYPPVSSFLSVFLVGLFLLINGTTEIFGQSQTITTSGTFTVPAGVTSITVEAWGGGGAGGGVTALARATGGGGGGGTYTKATAIAVTPGQVINVTIGAGGTGVSAANGNPGGTTIFAASTSVSAVGGNGGSVNEATGNPLNGAGANAATGITFGGGAGGTGNATAATNGTSGGGGGGAGDSGAGGAGTTIGGVGGAGTTMGGAGAAGLSVSGPGADATLLGGGGSGARNANGASPPARRGGAGAPGQIIVSYGAVLTIVGTTNHGSSCVGIAASPQTYTITNTSSFPATATNLSLTSNDPQFVITTGLSSTTIAPGGTATFAVTFTPTSGGAKSANITVSGSPALGNTPTIALSGTGNALPGTPTVGTITQPTCSTTTGSVDLSGLPTSAWTVTASPGGATLMGSTATATFSGLAAATTYTFKVVSGGCSSAASTDAVINADLNNKINRTSASGTDAQTACLSSAITPITYSTTGATGATVVGLPPGVTGTWASNVVTISGTPTNSGPFSYTVTLTGGCGTTTATGTLNVNAAINTISLSSGAGTNVKSVCANIAMTAITYTTTGATGVNVTGLPAGVTGTWSGNVVTIGGTPTASGTFNYTVNLIGGCPIPPVTGTITVSGTTSISYAGSPFCKTGTATVTQTGTTGGTYSAVSGLSINPTTGAIDLAASTPGTYTVSYAYTGTCASTVTASVTINALPITTFVAPATTTCIGSPVTINTSISSPTVTNYQHLWSSEGSVTLSTSVNPLSTTSSATFTGTAVEAVKLTYSVKDGNNCTSAPISTTVNVIAPPAAANAGIAQTKCETGTFTLAASMAGQPAGAVGTWSGPVGITFSNVNSPTSTASGVVAGTSTTLTWTVTNGNCTATSATVTLTNQMLRLSSTLTPDEICSGSTVGYTPTSTTSGAAFTWSRAAVPGISQAAATGSGNVNETLTNTTDAPISVTYAYIVTANGCSSAMPENVVVVVNPKPVVNNLTPAALCSGGVLTLSPANGVNGLIPANTEYSWNTPSVTGGMTGGSDGFYQPSITSTLTNSTSSVQTAIYTVTPTSNGCAGAPFTVTVVVKPMAAINAMTSTICSGSFSVTPTNVTNGRVPTGTTYTWTAPSVTGGITGGAANTTGATSISGSLSNPSASSETATYTVIPTTDGCVGASFTVTVTVKSTPGLSSTVTSPICSGSAFAFTPASTTSGATFAWSRAAIPGITEPATTGSGIVNEILTNTSANPISVIYAYTTTGNGCTSAPQNVSVLVKPAPKLSSFLTAAVCSPASFNYAAMSATAGTSFSWSRATVTGVTPAGTSSAVTSFPETLTNTSTAPVTVTYVFTMTADGCTNTQNVVVAVNPTPKLSSLLMPPAICSAAKFNYTATSATAGATYGWSRATNTDISQAATTGTGNVSETLTNTSALPVTVTYTYSITANSCPNTQNVTVVVNPTSTISSAASISAICSGTAATYTPTSATPGATFGWSRAAVPGIQQGAATGTGSLNEILTNTTTEPIRVTYVYTPTANNCGGTAKSVTIDVQPKLQLSSTLTPAAICSATPFAYTPTSAVAGATFAWSRAVVAGITEGVASGTGSISEPHLTNTTSAPIAVTYTFVITANGCSNSQNITVTVNPYAIPDDLTTAICSGSTFALMPQNITDGRVPAGTTYSWTTPSVTGGLTGGMGGTNANIINGTLTNPTNSAQTATYTVTPTANGCAGEPFMVEVTVNPKPAVTAMTAIICSGGTFGVTPTNGTNGTVPSGTNYSWSAPSVTGGLLGGASGSGTAIGGTLANPTISAQTATYTVTPTIGGCTGATFTVTVTVNPTPAINNFTTTICNGGTFSVTPVNGTNGRVPANTSYAWSSGSGTSISGTLSNLTLAPTTATYVVTPTVGTCPGSTFNVVVTVNPTPSVSGTLSVCVGATTTLTGSGTPATSGAWASASTGIATVNASGEVTGIAAGTSEITYTDATGCSKKVFVTVNPNPTTTITTATGNNFMSQGCTVALSATMSGGTAPYSPNTWSLSDITNVQFSGTTNNTASSTTNLVSPTDFGKNPITVVINFKTSDANGCASNSTGLTMTVYPKLEVTSITGASAFCIGSTAKLDVTITGGITSGVGRTIVWFSSNPAAATVSNTGLVTALATGNTDISVLVTDASGCTATFTKTIAITPGVSFTAIANNSSCNGANNGIICLATTGSSVLGYTYAWSNGASSICNPNLAPNISPNTYSVTITDKSTLCSQRIDGLVITEPGAVTATMTAPVTKVCQGSTPPSVIFTGSGGSEPYTFIYKVNGGANVPVTTTSGNSVSVPQPTGTVGTYEYTLVSVTSGVCVIPQTQTVTIAVGTPITETVNAGPDQPTVVVQPY